MRSMILVRTMFTIPRVVVALFIVLLAHAAAQPPVPVPDETITGREFYVAFPDTVGNKLDSRFPNTSITYEASLYIYSPIATNVVVSGPGLAGANVSVAAGRFTRYVLPSPAVVDVYNTVNSRAFHVVADDPIILYCYFAQNQGLEAWGVIPVERWGRVYQAACMPGELVRDVLPGGTASVAFQKRSAPSTILVIAAYDSTRVALTPPSGLRFLGNPPTMVMLNRGEVFQVASRVDTNDDADWQDDLATTLVEADKPVAVISGNTRASVVDPTAGVLGNAHKGLMAEWMPPADQLGTQFVYMPLKDWWFCDSCRTVPRAHDYVRIHNGNGAAVNGQYYGLGNATPISFRAKRDTLAEVRLATQNAAVFISGKPTMGMLHSPGTWGLITSNLCPGDSNCREYMMWAPYQVEMAPREQWTTFAPFFAPANPSGMFHVVSVVTDTVTARNVVREDGSRFEFTDRIAGTDLIWGAAPLTAGEAYWLRSLDGGTFAGQVVGFKSGRETFQRGGVPGALAQYAEYNAASYGYALASRRRILAPPDTLTVDTTQCCCGENLVRARFVNANPSGFVSAALDGATNQNMRLEMVVPAAPARVVGQYSIQVRMVPVDRSKPARATLVLTSLAGGRWTVEHSYTPDSLQVSPPVVEFGTVTAGQAPTRVLVVRNTSTRFITVLGIMLDSAAHGFVLPGRPIALPAVLAPGDSIIVNVQFQPDSTIANYVSHVRVLFGCLEYMIELRGSLQPMSSVAGDDVADGYLLEAVAAGDIVHVRMQAPRGRSVSTEVFDAAGRQVATVHTGPLGNGVLVVDWRVGAVPNGVYYVRLGDGNRSLVRSVLIAR